MASNRQQCYVQRWLRSYGFYHIFLKKKIQMNFLKASQIEINGVKFNVKVLVWDVSTQEILKSITCHVDTIYSLAVNRDGSYIATTSKDRKLRVIEPRTSIVISVGFNSIHITHTYGNENNGLRSFWNSIYMKMICLILDTCIYMLKYRKVCVTWEQNVQRLHFWTMEKW